MEEEFQHYMQHGSEFSKKAGDTVKRNPQY